jgi:ABC-2 type transport system ATP-binding protein
MLIAAKERKAYDKIMGIISTYWHRNKTTLQNVESYRDVDADSTVIEEIEKVNSIIPAGIAQHRLVINNLSEISLIADESMILGIIAETNSMRASIMKQLIGQEQFKTGDIFIMGNSLRSDSDEALKNISYCPNECALQKYLTGRQNLEIFGTLKCVTKEFVDQEITNKINSLCLKEFIDEPVKNYSEANRKLLGIAIATFGNPQVVILEEPFDELDVSLRSTVYNLLNKMRIDGKTIIIMSTNFEDCANICNKMVIVENGLMKYLDTPQNLKVKIGGTINISLQSNNSDKNDTAINYLGNTLSGIKLR